MMKKKSLYLIGKKAHFILPVNQPVFKSVLLHFPWTV